MRELKFLMTTTFYPPYHIGGACIHVKHLAEELVRQGHEVHVMFSLDAYYMKRGKPSSLNVEAGEVHLHGLGSPRGRLEPLLAYSLGKSDFFSNEFDKLVKDISPDIVHHHNISLLGYDLLRKRGQYLNVYTAHDYWLVCQRKQSTLFSRGSVCGNRLGRRCGFCALQSGRPPQIWRHRNVFAKAIENIDLAVAPSDYVGSVLSQRLGFPFFTIRNFVPAPPATSAVPEFSDYFLFAGQLEEHKGIVDLISIFKDHGQEIGAHLVVAGTGSLEGHLRKYVSKNSLEGAVHIVGWASRERLFPLLSHAHALIVPSVWPENCPLIALEALSVGTPIVMSNVGGLPEIAMLQGNGFVCDLANLKDTLIGVRNMPTNRGQIRGVYEQHFSPERFMRRYLELLEQRL